VIANEARHISKRTNTPWWHHPVKLDPFNSALALPSFRALFGPRFRTEATDWPRNRIVEWYGQILKPAKLA
jgi:hypothetical protein